MSNKLQETFVADADTGGETAASAPPAPAPVDADTGGDTTSPVPRHGGDPQRVLHITHDAKISLNFTARYPTPAEAEGVPAGTAGDLVASLQHNYFGRDGLLKMSEENGAEYKIKYNNKMWALTNSEGAVLATAVKPSSFKRRIDVIANDGYGGCTLALEPPSYFSVDTNVYDVTGNAKPSAETLVGCVNLDAAWRGFGLDTTSMVPMRVGLPVQLFCVWLVHEVWQRTV